MAPSGARSSRRAAVLIGAVALAGFLRPASAQKASPAEWNQWGGPGRNFITDARGLADVWPDGGPPLVWSRALGTGHSAIVASNGRLYTMYRRGNGREKGGPFDAEEAVVALDRASGETLWEHAYPSKLEDFNFGAGPHSTPLVVAGRVFTIGTNKQLFAFDAASGKVLWSHDLVEEYGSPSLLIRPVVKAGYGCSPIAYRDTVICSVGGPGQSVMAFRQDDGSVVWKSGDFLTSEAPPILIEVAGTPQLVVFGGGTVNGLDPDDGELLWSHPHDPGNDLNCSTPLWGEDNVLFVSSAYKAGSRALRLTPDGASTRVEELWFTSRARFMFLSAIRLGDTIYGTAGDFGPSFLTALDAKTGKILWQHRGFARASMIFADGRAILLDEDGDLAMVGLSPEKATVLSEFKLFDTTSWSCPTLVGTILYARDRERIVALDLGEK
jgi:outer membrane protein assembly factor BamB